MPNKPPGLSKSEAHSDSGLHSYAAMRSGLAAGLNEHPNYPSVPLDQGLQSDAIEPSLNEKKVAERMSEQRAINEQRLLAENKYFAEQHARELQRERERAVAEQRTFVEQKLLTEQQRQFSDQRTFPEQRPISDKVVQNSQRSSLPDRAYTERSSLGDSRHSVEPRVSEARSATDQLADKMGLSAISSAVSTGRSLLGSAQGLTSHDEVSKRVGCVSVGLCFIFLMICLRICRRLETFDLI